jgi:glycosyltransferase involved in cell wall biosynthesis
VKILLLFNRWAFPANDGGSLAMYQLAKGLHECGHTVTVFSLNPSRNYVDPKSIQDKKLFFDYTLVPINTDLSYIDALKALIKNKSYHAVRFYSREVEKQLTELLQNKTFDYIIADSIYMSWYIPIAKRISQAKVVLRLHNVENEIWTGVAKDETNILKRIYIKILASQLKTFEKAGIEHADGLITLSKNDMRFFEHSMINCPRLVSHTGINTEELSIYNNIAIKPKSIFHIAAMDWKPNVHAINWFISQVWPKILLTNPDAILDIAGKKMPAELIELKSKGYTNFGFVDNQYLFMSERIIMIVPLFAGSGIRIKIIEAMAMKKAIVATSKAVQGLDLINNTHLLIADDSKSFADAVNKLLNDEGLYQHIANNAYTFAKSHFDLKTNSNKIVEFLKNI